MTEDRLSFLLRFINGEGEFFLFGKGITSYPDGDENNRGIHEGCLELEKRGLIKRHYQEDTGIGIHRIVWKPVNQ